MARVTIQNGPEAGRVHEISSVGAVLGRAAGSDCDVPLGGASVSGRHARIYFDTDQSVWCVRDLGSVNGIRVNGRPVDLAEIRDGSIISVAEIEIRFSTRESSSSSAGLSGSVAAAGGDEEVPGLAATTGQFAALISNASFLKSIAQGGDIYLDKLEGLAAELRDALSMRDPAQSHLAIARLVESGQLDEWLVELRGIRDAEDNVLSNILELLGQS